MKRISLIFILAIAGIAVLYSCGKDKAKDRIKQREERLAQIRFKSDSLMAYAVPIDRPGGAITYHKLSRKEINDSTLQNAADYLNSLVIGLVRTSFQDENRDVTVEISQFATSNDAYGFYSLLRPAGVPFDSLGVESYFKNDTLCFTKADYVVIITSTADSNRTQTIRKIGKLINGKITTLTRPPQFFILFPYKWQIVPSQRYYSTNFMSINGLDSVYTIDYAVDEDTLTLFLSMDTSGAKLVMLSEWGETFGKVNTIPTEMVYPSGHAASFTHPELGQFVAGMAGNKLAGVYGYKRATGVQLVPRWISGIQ